MVAPTFKKATDSAVDGTNVKYGAPDIKYAFDVLDGTHSTDRVQQLNLEGLNPNFGYKALVRKVGSTYFGYREDGTALSTPSSTSAHLVIQAAIDYVSGAGGGKVFLKDATYTITTQITIPSKIELVGESREGTILRTASSLTSVAMMRNSDTTNGNTYITIANLSFDHIDVPVNTGNVILSFTKVYNSILYNCHIRNPSTTAAVVWDGFNQDTPFIHSENIISHNIADCTDRGTKPTNVHLFSLSDHYDTIFTNNIMRDSGGTTASNAAARFVRPRRSIISNNVAYNSGMTGFVFNTAQDSVIANNVSYNNGEHGMYFVSTSGTARCNIANNMCRTNGRKGFQIEGNDLLVANNYAYDNDETGMDLVGLDRSVITGNYCMNNGKDTAATPTHVRAGIRLSTASSNNTLNGNKCHDIQGTKTQTYGIAEEDATCDFNICQDNDLRNNLTAAVTLNGAGTVARNNTGFNPQGVATVTMTASPMTYTNADRVPELMHLRGGTVTDVSKNGITIATTATNASCWLEPGESMVITYTGSPTLVKDRK